MNADDTQKDEFGEANFESEILKSEQPVMVAFPAPCNKPRRITEPVLGEVADACAGRRGILGVNVEDYLNPGIWYQPRLPQVTHAPDHASLEAHGFGQTEGAFRASWPPTLPASRLRPRHQHMRALSHTPAE